MRLNFLSVNSLHTYAFEEAITTPTENSVRRVVAIQFIEGSTAFSTVSTRVSQCSGFTHCSGCVRLSVKSSTRWLASASGMGLHTFPHDLGHLVPHAAILVIQHQRMV